MSSEITFGPHLVSAKSLVFKQEHSYAMLVPNHITEGHIILCTREQTVYFRDLQPLQLFEISLAI